MAAQLWKSATVNAFNTTLNGGITAVDSTITLSSVTGLQAPGVIVIDRVDANNTATPTLREYISFTGISGSSLTGCTRGLGGSTAQAHNSSANVEETMDVTKWGDLSDFLLVSHDENGKIVATSMATLTSARIITSLNASGASTILGDLTIQGSLTLSGASISTASNFGINPVWVVGGAVSGATTSVGKPLPMPVGGSWRFFSAVVRTPVSGASCLIDINKNGTSIFDTGTRLYFPQGGTFVSTASILTKAFSAGDIFTVDLDSGMGSAADLSILGRGL